MIEFWIVVVQKKTGLTQLIAIVRNDADEGLPTLVRRALEPLIVQMEQAQSVRNGPDQSPRSAEFIGRCRAPGLARSLS